MNNNTKHLTFLDILIILLIAGISAVFVIFSITHSGQGDTVHIDSPDGMYEYQTDKNQTLRIQGRLGVTVIEIKDREFKFIDSPCLNKTCIHCGKIRRANIPVVCLPNGVSAYIVGKSDIDDISR